MKDINGPLAWAILELSRRIGRKISPLSDFLAILTLKEKKRANVHTSGTDGDQAQDHGHATVQGDPPSTKASD